MDAGAALALLDEVAAAIGDALGGLTALDDWGLAGTRPGQYRSDLAADAAALAVLEAARLDGAPVGVLSEESGWHRREAAIGVIVDPVDGSTNASRAIPWYATSLCAVDADGPLAALVINLATGERFEAARGGGAMRNGSAVEPSGVARSADAVVGLSGYPAEPLGWRQYRALGAAALDLCSVACGRLDAYVDCSRNAHGVWDYAAGWLVCTEAGAAVADALGRDLLALEHDDRRTPMAASTPELLAELIDRRAAVMPT